MREEGRGGREGGRRRREGGGGRRARQGGGERGEGKTGRWGEESLTHELVTGVQYV